MLEAVRVARSGFPVRLGHVDFFSRYHLLVGTLAVKCGAAVGLVTAMRWGPGGKVKDKESLVGTGAGRGHEEQLPMLAKCEMLKQALLGKGEGAYRAGMGTVPITMGSVGAAISDESIQLGLSKVF